MMSASDGHKLPLPRRQRAAPRSSKYPCSACRERRTEARALRVTGPFDFHEAFELRPSARDRTVPTRTHLWRDSTKREALRLYFSAQGLDPALLDRPFFRPQTHAHGEWQRATAASRGAVRARTHARPGPPPHTMTAVPTRPAPRARGEPSPWERVRGPPAAVGEVGGLDKKLPR